MIDEQKLLEWIESHKYYTALPVDNFLKPRKPLYTFVDPDELISEIKSGTLTPTASAEGWQPFETAPRDGQKFVALKVTIVDEYDDDYSREIPIRKNVEMIEPVLMQWVQFAKFIDGQFMEIPYKMYRNPVRYIGWAPIPPPQAPEVRDE